VHRDALVAAGAVRREQVLEHAEQAVATLAAARADIVVRAAERADRADQLGAERARFRAACASPARRGRRPPRRCS
jgi:hypothetical protein